MALMSVLARGLVSGLAASAMAASPEGETKAAPDVATVAIPAAGQTLRIGGDLKIEIGRRGESGGSAEDVRFTCEGVNTIDTPLPVGYPDPTPPGAIDLKMYPSVRRAQVSGETSRGREGMNEGFWPLFRHIQRREIAMTSPVEMEYRPGEGSIAEADNADVAKTESASGGVTKPKNDSSASNEKWTMAFLYRRAEQGATGDDPKDARVTIVDVPAQLVVSMGMKGDYSRELVARGETTLREWLATQGRFEAAGEARVLYYHGPSFRPWRKWAEVQIPIRERAAKAQGIESALVPANASEKPIPPAAPSPR
ncbi:MAG: heme-binding protein [Planctomycetota bacterium]|nr:heme-binding protein [Planctomycetota bacterium]